MVSGACFLRLMFTPHERSCLRVKWLDNHTQDHGRSQVHICRHVHETSSHTLQLQLQQQSFKTYQLTPVKCPHLSNEMTGQVDSKRSGPISQFPARRIVSSCCLFLLDRALFCYRLRAPCNSEHSEFIGHYSNKQTSYHSATKLVSRHTSHNVHEETGTTFHTGLSKTSPVQFASGEYVAYLAGKLLHVMDVYVVSHVEFEVLLQKTELICIFEESVTLSKQIVTSGTQVSNGTEDLAFSFR